MPKPSIVAIVPAGGVGQRAGTNIPKQYKNINNKAMLRLTVMALLNDTRINKVIVGVAQDDGYIDQALLGLENVIYTRTGGASRADTVANTISHALNNKIINAHDWALVHDAARPGLPKKSLNELIDQCLLHKRGGILAMPAADTVKQAMPVQELRGYSFKKLQKNNATNNADSTANESSTATDNKNLCQLHTEIAEKIPLIDKSIDRNQIWLAQTPQMFPALELLQAINTANNLGLDITDESSAMEQVYNYKGLLIKGSTLNFKVTWPEDFDLIENIIKT